ncbi:MAG: antibiotic biosynthesis monooxygenase [Tepidiformaceae bacterium]
MAYVRLSIARPRRGEEARFEQVMRRLTEVTAQQPGCTAAYIMKPDDGSGEIARISFYDDSQNADTAAQGATIMALRSELHLLSEAGHVERGFSTL